MPRAANPSPKTRLNIELPERWRLRLEQLRTVGASDSITEVVRRAVSIYDVLITAIRERGEKVILRSPGGAEREIIIP